MSVSKTVALSGQEELRFPPTPCGGVLRRYNKLKAEKEASHIAYLESLPGDQLGARQELYQDSISAKVAAHEKALKQLWDDCLASIGEVICPFCFYAIPARDAVDEKKWKYGLPSISETELDDNCVADNMGLDYTSCKT
jgi:hypothetical protein